jgi:hypothetical protein
MKNEGASKKGRIFMSKFSTVSWLILISICNNLMAHTEECSLEQKNKLVDMIVFSFNRPLQLYATLESVAKYFYNINEIYVLYRVDNDAYYQAYQEVKNDFPFVHFVKQGNNPRNDFKPLFLECFFASPAEYVFFAVDDDVVTDFVDVRKCVEAMELVDAYGFYLRLGTNVVKQYLQASIFPIPPLTHVKEDIYQFKFAEGIGEWCYPNSLDLALFKKSKIEDYLKNISYSSPNTLEAGWAGAAAMSIHLSGLCFEHSRQFTLPLNIVQQDWYNPNENSFSVEDLLTKWKKGLKMNVDAFCKVDNSCAFMGYTPQFIGRHS